MDDHTKDSQKMLKNTFVGHHMGSLNKCPCLYVCTSFCKFCSGILHFCGGLDSQEVGAVCVFFWCVKLYSSIS
jgi:hypothetical protein